MAVEGRRFAVTGASSGIGRATACLLADLGARVLLIARSEARLRETQDSMAGTGHDRACFDLAEVDGISGFLEARVEEFGKLDGLVHGAGIQETRPLRVLSAAQMEDTLRINTTAAMALSRSFSRPTVRQDRGSIVLVSSVMALVGQPGLAAYAASKGAIGAMTRALALELARAGIRVNCVAPGHVRTPMAADLRRSLTEEQLERISRMHPLGLGEPIDVAQAIAFLLADTGRWITGTTLVVDGGYTAQ